MTTTHESLYKTPWVELMKRTSDEDGTYIYIREPWLINGQAISILPYRLDCDEIELLVRCEVADVPVMGTIKGGCDKEGEAIEETAVRELLEEAGYSIHPSQLIHLGTARTSKLNTTTMNLFAVDLTDEEQGEAIGDGTKNEANAYCKWISEEESLDVQDPIIHTSMVRLINQSGRF
ncbi:NUDIX hydrolase [Paenibacillus sp. Mc5Re-14]|uniref:NUDIX hydrolase n=1 Tax=Paenibacillus sp. Mc5Re-14 TaxID=1030529 RepID=UPI000B06FD7A|nr:NUDIX domain-containing protein [Paenibacillus sp. Mc5Re-14]